MSAREQLRRLRMNVAAAFRLLVRDPRSLLLTARMSLWIAVISIVARLLPLPAMFRLAETRRRWSPPARLPAEEIARRIDRLFHAGLVKDGSCWKRAAVLRRYLLLSGIETEVVFGVRREDEDRLVGHAWLERDGLPFLEREEPRYTVTFRYPPR
ncbi:MAG TPA: lasso peptide biosynthesis B2 protein [Thermoanaerobaculia bacterium]|nr:lasso peptide biosynthesis B2 protein [Thermoanaerobaculia bacterium]